MQARSARRLQARERSGSREACGPLGILLQQPSFAASRCYDLHHQFTIMFARFFLAQDLEDEQHPELAVVQPDPSLSLTIS